MARSGKSGLISGSSRESIIENCHFTHVASLPRQFIGTNKHKHKKKVQLSTGLVWNTNMAAVRFWDNNMTDVTSCENAVYNMALLSLISPGTIVIPRRN